MAGRGEGVEPVSVSSRTDMLEAAVLGEQPSLSPGPPPATAPRPFPRSDASICFALDQLDQGLQAEEAEEARDDEEHRDEAAAGRRTAAAAAAVHSHPLDFVAQYPHIAIVTTAALPWLTGTAVNPALRATYLWRRGHSVTLMVPWLPPASQPRLFPDGMVFSTPEEQEEAMMGAIQARVPFPLTPGVGASAFRVVFYPGRYDPALGSIMPDGDLQPLVPRPVDCIVLEEPEHLTWYHTGKRWTRAFPRCVPVIGVMHTNYVDYVRHVAGDTVAATLGRLNSFLCRQHCHKVVKLSDAVQALPRQETCFVHGVSDTFLEVGRAKAETAAAAAPPPHAATHADAAEAGAAGAGSSSGGAPSSGARRRFTRHAYFLGKALYAKGLRELLDRFAEHKQRCDLLGLAQPVVDIYGKGEQEERIKAEAARLGLALNFLGAKDHMSPDMAEYQAFVNPSTSDVVATTSAEALAMGKWLVVPRHPCNEFFSSFANCLVYDDAATFSRALEHSLAAYPAPLSEGERSRLSWDAATDRFLHCCASVELERGPPLARVAAKTGWVGYVAGYGVFAVVAGAIGSVRLAMARVAGGGGGGGNGAEEGEEEEQEEGELEQLRRVLSSHALALDTS